MIIIKGVSLTNNQFQQEEELNFIAKFFDERMISIGMKMKLFLVVFQILSTFFLATRLKQHPKIFFPIIILIQTFILSLIFQEYNIIRIVLFYCIFLCLIFTILFIIFKYDKVNNFLCIFIYFLVIIFQVLQLFFILIKEYYSNI